MTEPRQDFSKRKVIAFGLLSPLILLAVLYIASPWGNTPFYDDFSYCWTAKSLANTGHLLFNGWSEPMVGVQAFWGAGIIRVFGWSFESLRISMFAWAMACAALMYATGTTIGLSPRFAFLGSLALCLCPIMLPLESSFMTDVPSVFFTLVVAYSTARFVEASRRDRARVWLVVSCVACVLSYSVRQSGSLLLVPVAALAAFGPHSSRLRGFALCCILFAGGACIALGSWMASQPDTHPAHLAGSIKASFRHPGDTSTRIAMFGLTLALACLPASVLSIRWRKQYIWWWSAGAALAAAALLVEHFRWNTWSVAFRSGIITERGVRGNFELLGERPVVLPIGVIVALTVLAVISLTFVVRAALTLGKSADRLPVSKLWFLAQFAFCGLYLLAITIRSAGGWAFDRYLVPVLPCVLLGLLTLASIYLQSSAVSRAVEWPAWILLGGFAAFGALGTHDFYAERMAVTRLADDLVKSGVSKTSITAGTEYDAITQLETAGTVDQQYVITKGGPILACVPDSKKIPPGNWFLPCAPSINPKFMVAAGKLPPGFTPTVFPTRFVKLWLPPFRIAVQAASFFPGDRR